MAVILQPDDKIKIAPSILSADFANLGIEIKAVQQAGGDWIHIDVMDGHFVPNITLGAQIVTAIRPYVKTIMDVHLMVSPVDKCLADFAMAGGDILTIHAEAEVHLDRSLHIIRSLGCKAGVALNIATPLSQIEYCLDKIDLILIMTVNPGFGGQKFIMAMEKKIADAHKMIARRPIYLQVDGGITPSTARLCARAGANVFVAGSAIFNGAEIESYRQNIAAIRKACES